MLDEVDLLECFTEPGKSFTVGEVLQKQRQIFKHMDVLAPDAIVSLWVYGNAGYKEKISAEVNKSLQYSQKNKYIYVKNDPENYSIMTTCGSQELALKWAETKCQEYKDLCFHKHNPCTMVFRLVRQLIGQDEDLNKELSTVKLGHS